MKHSSKKSLVATEFHLLGTWLRGPGRTVAILAALLGLFVVVPYLAYPWWHKPQQAAAKQTQIGPRQVKITQLPNWIHTDLCAEVFLDPMLDGSLSILDEDLIDRIHGAFSRHPWVARVRRVSKHPPAEVCVELDYRRPVCMVAVPDGLLPVDTDGFLLPTGENFTPSEADAYPCLAAVDRGPPIPPGQRWQDARVIGGAEIAAAIGSAWPSLHLKQIVPLATDPTVEPTAGRSASEPFFLLTTQAGSRIFWGYAPGANMPGELSAAEKVGRLKRYIHDQDTFDMPDGRPQTLDVRTL